MDLKIWKGRNGEAFLRLLNFHLSPASSLQLWVLRQAHRSHSVAAMGKSDKKEASDADVGEGKSYDEQKKFISVIAKPLADEKLCKKALKLAKKASKKKQIKRGVKEVVKAIRKNVKG